MANYYTRTIRVYGINKRIPVDQICKSISETALFEHELIWNLNEKENHLDLKWNSKKGAGELGIDFSKYFVWEIKSCEENEIYFYNRNSKPICLKRKKYFAFDSVYIESANEYINETFLNHLFPTDSNLKNIKKQINIQGSYKSHCSYEIGEIEQGNLSPVKEKDLNHFLTPRGDLIMINEFNSDFKGSDKLNEFMNFANLYWKSDEYELHEGFRKLIFMWNGRIVNTIERGKYSYDMWKGKNSDWWDNCKLPAWIKFTNERESSR